MSLKDRFPALYNVYALDDQGRPKADSNWKASDGGSSLLVVGPKVPSEVEQLKASLAAFGVTLSDSQTSQVVADLNEYDKLTAPPAPELSQPATPTVAAPTTGAK